MTDAPAVAVDIPAESAVERTAADPVRGDTFPKLVWVHRQWEQHRRHGTPPPAVEREYRETKHFHQVGDWETRHAPAIAASLHLYHRAGAKAGRLVYVSGMLYGVIALGLLAVALVPLLKLFGAFDRNDVRLQDFFVAYSAGAIGAVVSVVSRMASTREGRKFAIDFEVGRPALRWLGSFRPFLGAIFGLVVYFALRGRLIQVKLENVSEFEYYTVFAFLAGFSERFTQVILGGAERVLKPADTKPSDSGGP